MLDYSIQISVLFIISAATAKYRNFMDMTQIDSQISQKIPEKKL